MVVEGRYLHRLAPDQERSPGREAGVTLIELLTVLAILSGVLALSVGVYRKVSVSSALPAAVSRVSTIVRSARNYSVSTALPSKVFIEPERVGRDGEVIPGRISAFGYELVAGWHFEDYAPGEDPLQPGSLLKGALNESAEVAGDEVYVIRGKIGRALYFSPDGVGGAVVADHRPRYNSPRGFSLEAWVLFEQPELTERMLRRKQRKKGAWVDPRREDRFAVISKQGSYELGTLGDGAVYVAFGEENTEDERVFETAGRAVVSSRWTHLRVSYDGVDLVVEVDGMRREWFPLGFRNIHPEDWPEDLFPERVPESSGPLTVSRPDRIFIGAIDEPKVRVALEPQSYVLPAGITFWEPRRPSTLYFDTRGALDPMYHRDPVRIRLTDENQELPEQSTTTVVVAEATAGEAVPEEDVGDPLAALTRYLADHAEEATEADEEHLDLEKVRSGEVEEVLPKGRLEEVIVDLTGTIRG